MSPNLALFTLLTAAWLAAEAYPRVRKMVSGDDHAPPRLPLYAATHVPAVLFGLDPWAALWIVPTVAAHLALDAWQRSPRATSLTVAFAWLLHLGVVLGVTRLWQVTPWLDLAPLAYLGLLVVVFALNVHPGAHLVALVLRRFPSEPPPANEHATRGVEGAGALIGVLERCLISLLVALGQWGAIGFVLTAKSVARFKKLEEQRFAEAYLIGTLTSVLVAIGTGGLLRAFL